MGRYISISFLVSSCGFRVLESANLHAKSGEFSFPEQNTEDSNTESVESTLQ